MQIPKTNTINIIVWLSIVIFSLFILTIGNKYATRDASIFSGTTEETYKAKVTSVTESVDNIDPESGNANYESQNRTIKFKCIILDNNSTNEISAEQMISVSNSGTALERSVKSGDIITVSRPDTNSKIWLFTGYYRINRIVFLLVLFSLITIIIGRIKGLNALISLSITTLFIFTVFIPWILGGHNIYSGLIFTCVFIINTSLLLIEGISVKCLVTITGCTIGTMVSGIIPLIINRLLHLSGIIDEHSMYLMFLHPGSNIDLLGIFYASVIIGSLGAVMDLAMDISSSLHEICLHVPQITFHDLYKSGMSISRDIIGTMTNTLILAYIGSSLPSILVLIVYASSITDFFNLELVACDFVQAFSGGIALLLTAPITVVIAGYLYPKQIKHNHK